MILKQRIFWRNLVIYLGILLGGLYLYNPFHQTPENKPRSSVQFIYARF